jgi:hypothetical protein
LAWAAEPPSRVAADEAFQTDLAQFAAKCDELKLPREAALVREWFVVRLPDRQYLFVPPEADPHQPATEAPKIAHQWYGKFRELRRTQAERLFALAKEYLDHDNGATAYQLLHEVLREDPDHAAARSALGYLKSGDTWRAPGPAYGAKQATLAHSYLKFPARTYSRITTPHFQVTTNAESEAGMRFGRQLETLYTVWSQVFFRYASTTESLKLQLEKPAAPRRLAKPYEVVLFRNREEYLANLATVESRLEVSKGIYLDKKRTAFFYLGDDRTDAIAHHEVTHQLFQETARAAGEVGGEHNFWIVEGIALYMESLRTNQLERLGYVTLGGWDAERLQYARHHVFNGRHQRSLEDIVSFSRESLQQDADIARIYTQSAGVAHYLMDGARGKYRAATVNYLASVYAGRSDRDALARLTNTSLAEHDTGYQNYLRVSDDDVLALPSPGEVRALCLGHQPISDRGLVKIAECSELRWLDLAATNITAAGLAPLAKLEKIEQLNLEQTPADDAALAWIGKLPALRELDLSNTSITDAGLMQLAALRNLEVLWLTSAAITDASAALLSRFEQLNTLDLEGTKVSPEARRRIEAALPKLRQP